MNQRQRILTYAMAPIIFLTLFFVPWRVQNGYKVGYVISPYWRPVPFDEGGALPPVFLYVEWGYWLLFLLRFSFACVVERVVVHESCWNQRIFLNCANNAV